ncbi:MAG: CinA family protein [Candidatus Omnitrophica bacterium]|nr:CinA family protein [Candidatus Omnitrophota bacterium]
MQNLIKQAHKRLLKSGQTVATAESCTAGLLSSLLTLLPGSSRYFILGITTYSNKVKGSVLKVPAALIRKKGAVSKETALLMAQKVRKLAKADLGISITGIAGPDGGTPRKPVGTVFIALSSKNKSSCKKFVFKGNRNSIRKQAAIKALQLLNANIYSNRITSAYKRSAC